MLTFYRSSAAARHGTVTTHLNADVWCVQKALGNEEVLIIVNMRNQVVNYTLPQSLAQTSWTDVRNGNALTLATVLNLAPYQFYLLQNNP
jgi:hypothetical protein